jgi:Zn-dependent protease
MEKGEIRDIAVAVIIMALLLMFNSNPQNPSGQLTWNGYYLIIPILILAASIIPKYMTAHYIDAELKFKAWGIQRFWISTWAHFKKPVPVGIIFPLLLGFLSGGFFKLMTFIQFNATASPRKTVKKYGIRRFAGIMEWDDAMISFYGFIGLLLLSLVAHFIASPVSPFKDLAKYSLIYAACNLIPFSQLDGSRLFYGSKPLYVFTLLLTLIVGMIVLV